MSLLLIHITDAHTVAADTAVTRRGRHVAAAALSEIMDIDEVHVLITGDMVQSGKADEYTAFEKFLTELKGELVKYAKVPIRFLNVPGNHDCDFGADQSLREMLLRSASQDQTNITTQIADVLGKPQEAYKGYVERWNEVQPDNVSVSCATLKIDGATSIRYVLINSALFSRKEESQGKLLISIPKKEDIPADADRVIFLMHHPLGWLAPDNARELAQFASSVGDLFFLGHEHENQGHQTRELYSNSSVAYLHGHLLNGYKDQGNSGFQTVEIAKAGFNVRVYALDGDSKYQKKKESGANAWPSEKRVRGLGFSDDFYLWLIEAGANFTHRRKTLITLADIFVWPELRKNNQVKNGDGQFLVQSVEDAFEELIDGRNSLPPVVVIKGGEQSGKTALAKKLCQELNKQGLYSLFLDASSLSSWDPARLPGKLDTVIERVYGRKSLDEFKQLAPDQRVLIIDNFDLSALGANGMRGLRAIKKAYGKLFLVMDSFPGLDIALNEFLRDEDFVDSANYDVLPLSYGKRHELIEHWFSIGADPNSDPFDQDVLAARMAKLVDEALGRNFIPAIPLFVLIILQRSELEQDLNTVVKSGTHGFLYEVLINQAITTHVSLCSLDTSIAYLSRVAYEMFSRGFDDFAEAEYEKFHVDYIDEFDLELPLRKFSAQLEVAGVLITESGRTRFKFPYHYYYFLAKELARLPWIKLEPIVDGLSEQLHTERAANILLFLAHFSRNSEIANMLLVAAKSTLERYKEIDIFSDDDVFAKYSVPQIRQVLIDSSEQARSRLLNDGSCDEKLADDVRSEVEEIAAERLKSKLDDALQMNRAFKTLQVLGQLLRNLAGSIPKEEKRRIARACVDLGLRVLGFLATLINENADELLSFRGLQLRVEFTRKHKDGSTYVVKTDDEIADILDSYLPNMFANLTMGTFVKISNAIGSEELTPTLEAVLSENKTDELLLLATRLENFSAFPEAEVKAFSRNKIERKNVLPYSILRRFVVRRFHLFPARKELKESIAHEFSIKTQPLRALQFGKD